MLKKQAPGETILKVGGMLLLFLGVLLAFGSGNNLSLVMKGSSDSAVVELQPAGGKQCDGSGGRSDLPGSWRGWSETGW